MKLLLTLTLGIASCGIGWGQEATIQPRASLACMSSPYRQECPALGGCDAVIAFGGISKTVREVFPEECGNPIRQLGHWVEPKPEPVDVKSLKSANSCEKIKAAIASAPKLKHRAPIIDATKIPDAFNCPLSVFAVDNLDLMLKMSAGSEVFIFKLKPQTGDHQ